MPNHRPLSKARITAKKRETHGGVSDFLANRLLMRMFHFCDCPAKSGSRTKYRVKYWEIIADNLGKAGSNCCVSALDSRGRATFIADAHLDDGKWFVV
jgi:hypothetical protein